MTFEVIEVRRGAIGMTGLSLSIVRHPAGMKISLSKELADAIGTALDLHVGAGRDSHWLALSSNAAGRAVGKTRQLTFSLFGGPDTDVSRLKVEERDGMYLFAKPSWWPSEIGVKAAA